MQADLNNGRKMMVVVTETQHVSYTTLKSVSKVSTWCTGSKYLTTLFYCIVILPVIHLIPFFCRDALLDHLLQ